MRRSELIGKLARIPSFPRPSARLEQVATSPEAAAELLFTAERLDGLGGRSVVDLGAGTGRLAIGAALLGADPVVGVEVDPGAAESARAAAVTLGVEVELVVGEVSEFDRAADLVMMNPPFGAQRRHADRPFFAAAFRLARRSIYSFALEESRTFIARHAVAHGAHVLETRPVRWELERTFPHHRRDRVGLAVDLWAISTGTRR
ncbi:MAG TPA: methyltransferase [Thermoplasmata archaeon]|nr:methyltransferase [Thermoplasmata archaeon]